MTNKVHVMVDIETLGREPGAIITTIGAVVGTVEDGITDRYYAKISPVNAQSKGLEFDADTVRWWSRQKPGVFKESLSGTLTLEQALEGLTTFIKSNKGKFVWGNAPSFDCSLLEAAYKAVDMKVPWLFYNERCFRTLKNLLPQEQVKFEGDKHNALHDAEYQFNVMQAALQQLETLNE